MRPAALLRLPMPARQRCLLRQAQLTTETGVRSPCARVARLPLGPPLHIPPQLPALLSLLHLHLQLQLQLHLQLLLLLRL